MLQETVPTTSYIELFKLIAPIAFFIINLGYATYLFIYKDRKEDSETARRIKLDWFKVLILDNNLKYFHGFFEKVEDEMRKLINNTNNKVIKDEVNENIIEYNKEFRVRFIDSLLAVDSSIYDNLIDLSDDLIDKFTHRIFDEGINLSHKPKFEEIVVAELSKSKTEMIKTLFIFDGNPKNYQITSNPKKLLKL